MPLALVIVLFIFFSTTSFAGDAFIRVPAGEFHSIIKYENSNEFTKIAAFELMKTPVSNAQFLLFLHNNPQWQRGRVANIFAEEGLYLSHWQDPLTPEPKAKLQQPVTQISWFAASAYCQSQGARLPTWIEWEYVAAANDQKRDARKDAAWREYILSWYAKPASSPLANIGSTTANVYGIQDLHGLIWEWVQDYSSLLVSDDNRNTVDADKIKFCGASALSIEDKENYPIMMRVAMLSALEAVNSTSSLGFRCARNLP